MPAREGWQGEPHKWGVPLLLHRQILFLYPLFSLTQEAQNIRRVDNLNPKHLAETAPCKQGVRVISKKKDAVKESFALCGERPTLRALDGRSLFEKATENKSVCSRNTPTNQKLWAYGINLSDHAENHPKNAAKKLNLREVYKIEHPCYNLFTRKRGSFGKDQRRKNGVCDSFCPKP